MESGAKCNLQEAWGGFTAPPQSPHRDCSAPKPLRNTVVTSSAIGNLPRKSLCSSVSVLRGVATWLSELALQDFPCNARPAEAAEEVPPAKRARAQLGMRRAQSGVLWYSKSCFETARDFGVVCLHLMIVAEVAGVLLLFCCTYNVLSIAKIKDRPRQQSARGRASAPRTRTTRRGKRRHSHL